MIREGPIQSRSVGTTLLALAVALGVHARAVADQTFTVTNNDSQSYVIDGQNNPALTLVRGQTYLFNISAVGHPFWLKTIQGPTQANSYNNGVTNNGVQQGMLTFAVPLDAPSTLFYNCEFHSPMTGTIHIMDASSTATATTIPTPTATPESTMTPTPILTPSPIEEGTASPTVTPTAMPVICTGDCNGDDSVTVDELVTLVNIALGTLPPSACARGVPAGEPVNVVLIVRAVVNALNGCTSG